MTYTIRPIGPEDAEGAAALRRMPGVFENTLGLPSYRTADSEAFIAGLGPDDHNFVAVAPASRSAPIPGCAMWARWASLCMRTTRAGVWAPP